MKTLKQKWIDALLIFVSVLCALGIVYLFALGIYNLTTLEKESDKMTVQQAIEKRYKSCVMYSSYPAECATIKNLPN